MEENSALVKLTAATHMLAEAKTLDEVKYILNIAEAARAYARAAKLGLEAYNHAAEVKARAERKAGEMLAQLERGAGGDQIRQPVQFASEYKNVLDDNEIGYKTAERWQAVAEMPENEFEKHLEDMRGERPITTNGMLKEIQTEKRTEARAEMARAGALIEPSNRWTVYHGDITDWEAPRQYDFIITDPPYPREFLPLWGILARRANEWLKEGGLLIAMSGQSYLDEIYTLLSASIEYYWTAAYLTPGQPTPLRQVNVNSTWKPLLIYSKGKYTGKIFGDVFVSAGNDKENHKWGQSKSGMFDIVSKICLPGQHILDPFCGAGTTGVAALQHGCLFDGLELEEENVNISKARLNDAIQA